MATLTIGARVAQVFYGERQEGEVIAMRRPDAFAGMVRNHAAALETARRSPTYIDQEGREGPDHVGRAAHHARTAIEAREGLERQLAAALAKVERQDAAIERLSEAMQAENLRAVKAEIALGAVTARRDGWPPAVRPAVVNVTFGKVA